MKCIRESTRKLNLLYQHLYHPSFGYLLKYALLKYSQFNLNTADNMENSPDIRLNNVEDIVSTTFSNHPQNQCKFNNVENSVSMEILEHSENKCEFNSKLPQKAKNSLALKSTVKKKEKDPEKLKCVNSMGNRSSYQRRYPKPPVIKRKSAPIYVHMSNPSAEVVLRERKVEIKDLESQVTYLQNQIKELRVENRTLLDLQNRHEKELKKFKGGVADIPSLLRSHKDEIKAIESNVTSLRRELKDCQRDLKIKSDMILKKDQQLDKLNLTVKRSERHLQEVIVENKELKLNNKKFEEESKKLYGGNEELKSKNDRLQKKIQQMTSTVLNLEEKLGTAEHFKGQLKDEFCKFQKKYDELLQSEAALKKSLQVSKTTVSTQTNSPETSSVSCMTDNSISDFEKGNTRTIGEEFEGIKCALDLDQGDKIENSHRCTAANIKDDVCNVDFPVKFVSNNISSMQHKPRKQKKLFLKPMNSVSSVPISERRHNLMYARSDEDYKLLSANDSELQVEVFINKQNMKKAHLLAESRAHKYYDGEKDIIDASFTNGTQCQRHKRIFSNLTLKQNSNKVDWINS